MQNGLKVQLRCLRLVSNQTPSLRFPGFFKPWEQKKLGENVDFYTGLTYSPENVTKEGTLVLRSSNVKNAEIVNADNVYVDPKYVNSKNVEIGDVIVVVRNGSRNLIGKHASVKEEMSNTVIGAFMTGIRSEAPGFINALLDTRQFAIEINKNLGATINQITTGNFKSMQFYFPHHNEQVKLGGFFKNLDDMISLHQQELDTLKQTKQGFLQKMFPKEGESVPEVRIPGFIGEWKQVKLSDIKDVRDGTHESPKYHKEGFPLVTSKNLKEYGLDMKDVSLISEEDFRSINKRSKVDVGDILFGMIGTIGNPILVDRKDFAIKNVALIKNGGDTANEFLIQILKSSVFERYIRNENAGNTQKFIGLNKIRDFKFLVPSSNEQIQIGNFFKQIDEVIALQQQELDVLKQTKKAFLQKMFV